MTLDAWLVVGILVIMFGLLIWDRWPTWAVFSLALTAILTLNLAPEGAALSGFSNSGVLTVVVLYIVAAGMYRTGAISMIITRVVGQPHSEREANVKILPLTAFGSAFLNNTPIVAMLIPVIADLGRSARLAVSKIYMSVSNASILGGTATLIGTSSNLIIAGLVAASFGEDLGVFFPTRVGLPLAIIGLLFLLFVAPLLLADRGGAEDTTVRRMYRAEFYLPEGSQLAGRTIAAAGFADPVGAELLTVERAGVETVEIAPELTLEEGDTVVFASDIEALPNFWTTIGLRAANPRTEAGHEYGNRLVEAVVAEEAPFVGRTISDTDLLEHHEKLVAISRRGVPVDAALESTVIEAGDNVVIEVREEFLDEPHEDVYALTHRLRGFRVQRVSRAIWALLIVLGMILLSAFGVMSLFNAALLAVIALIAIGAISFSRAWRSINWQTYVVLAAAVGIEPAITESGLADVISDAITSVAGDNELLALAVVFLGAILLTNIVTNAAAAAIMFPIVVGIVATLGVAWEPFVVILMLGTSYVFINPAGYQTHLMVYEPGGYRFTDFVKVGLPLTVLLGVFAVPLTAWLYPI
jgi:di/tricarboxylate transporter